MAIVFAGTALAQDPTLQSLKLQKQKVIHQSMAADSLAVGILNAGNLHHGFLNDGGFAAGGTYWPEVPGGWDGRFGYVERLDLWIGVPEGPWTPQVYDPIENELVSAGPSVVGTAFIGSGFVRNGWEYNYTAGNEWRPARSVAGRFATGSLRLTDVVPDNKKPNFLHLPLSSDSRTWPRNSYGFPYWPGPQRGTDRLNPIPIGTQDIFWSLIDDRELRPRLNHGYPLKLKVDVRAHAFSESYADDFIVFAMDVINESQWDYENVYMGVFSEMYTPAYYVRQDSHVVVQSYNVRSRTGLHRFHDFGDGHQERLDLWTMADDPNSGPFSQRLPGQGVTGIAVLKTPNAYPEDGRDNDNDGQVDEPEGESLGMTGWHWMGMANYHWGEADRTNYKVMAGDTSGLPDIRFGPFSVGGLFFLDTDDSLNLHFDSVERISRQAGSFQPGDAISSTGPFRFPARDTVRFAFALVSGQTTADVLFSARTAQHMFRNDLVGMMPPEAPHVIAIPGDGHVRLYWDARSEIGRDPLTRYQDFEGYRIFRTSEDPAQGNWGDAILDSDGKVVGHVPVAQFDRVDGISGTDPQYPHLKLGDETGLVHEWTDSTVQNGVTYWYAVEAYDQGLTSDPAFNPAGWPAFQSLQNPPPTDAGQAPNLVRVTPAARASDYEAPRIALAPEGQVLGNGPIFARVVDPFLVTGHTYRVTLEDSITGEMRYHVYDVDRGDYVLSGRTELHGEEGPVFDGLQLNVWNHGVITVWPDSSQWLPVPGRDVLPNWRISGFTTQIADLAAAGDYEIRFKSEMDSSKWFKKTAPFEIWNTIRDQEIEWDMFNRNPRDTSKAMEDSWTDGDYLTVVETVEGKLYFNVFIRLYSSPQTEIIDGVPTQVDRVPQPGDIARIYLSRPYLNGDSFILETSSFRRWPETEYDLSQIKVVPNPYVVSAAWELGADERRLAFTRLPSRCKISIYTLTGDLVRELSHSSPFSGMEFWDLRNGEGFNVAYGMYLYVVETPDGKQHSGKFGLMR